VLIHVLNEAGERQKDQDGDIDADVKPYMKPCRGPGFQNDATRLMIVRANVRPNPTWLIGPTAILIAEPFSSRLSRYNWPSWTAKGPRPYVKSGCGPGPNPLQGCRTVDSGGGEEMSRMLASIEE